MSLNETTVKAIARHCAQASKDERLTYSRALEATSTALGYRNWNALKASFGPATSIVLDEDKLAPGGLVSRSDSDVKTDADCLLDYKIYADDGQYSVSGDINKLFFSKPLEPYVAYLIKEGRIEPEKPEKNPTSLLISFLQPCNPLLHEDIFNEAVRQTFPENIPDIIKDIRLFNNCMEMRIISSTKDILLYNSLNISSEVLTYIITTDNYNPIRESIQNGFFFSSCTCQARSPLYPEILESAEACDALEKMIYDGAKPSGFLTGYRLSLQFFSNRTLSGMSVCLKDGYITTSVTASRQSINTSVKIGPMEIKLELIKGILTGIISDLRGIKTHSIQSFIYVDNKKLISIRGTGYKSFNKMEVSVTDPNGNAVDVRDIISSDMSSSDGYSLTATFENINI